MGELVVIGVRHHSPACARVVEHVIATRRPTHVLIEGPSDFSERIGELVLGHRLPIAIYSYALTESSQRAVGAWTPLCEYSPEWVALSRGHTSGAAVRFIDLPAWDPAFADVENRYADRELDRHHRLVTLSHALGFDSTDTLWDHLFEDPARPVESLARELEDYFEAYRADDEASERDMRREAFMARHMAWAMAQSDGVVLVVCGGFHAPALKRSWASASPEIPACPEVVGTCGSYVVPFSMRRLDSFAGYASGMPSPAFYQAVWDVGEQAWQAMLFRAVEGLRRRGQPVSTADVLAANELAVSLARLRGHGTPRRSDVLDAMCSAFLKDALSQPPPWTMRGVLPRGTDPVLVEVVATFSGEARGVLAPETPRPPLVADVEAALLRCGLSWDVGQVRLDPWVADERRHVLYRLAVLEVPGVTRLQRADVSRGSTARAEVWRVERSLETEAVLIERAVYGADLASAALAKVFERLSEASGVDALVAALEDTWMAGFAGEAGELLARAGEAIEREASLGVLGAGLARLVTLARTTSIELAALKGAALLRAAWLLEGRDGEAPLARDEVAAVAAMASAVMELDEAQAEPVLAVFARRAHAATAPSWLRGACLGALWHLGKDDGAMTATSLVAVDDRALGDFLTGLLALAREPFGRSELLALVDTRLATLDETTFFEVLPSLRAAFAQLPPQERLVFARRLAGAQAAAMVAPLPEVDQALGAALEARAFAVLERYGLLRAREVSR